MVKSKNSIDMCTGPILPKLLRLVLPLMLSSILQLLFNAADLTQAVQDMSAMVGLSGLPLASAEAVYYLKSYGVLFLAGILGAIAHSLGQMAVAIAVTATPGLAIYLPIMILCSIITGAFTGLCAQFLLNRGGKFWKTILK